MSRSGLVRRAAGASLLFVVLASLVGCAFIEGYVAVPKTTPSAAGEDRRDPYDLAVGECFNDPGLQYTWVEPVPCDSAHDFEVFFDFDLAGDEYPGSESVLEASDERCGAAFTDFVGVAPEDSAIQFSYYKPGVGAWLADDLRTVICFAFREGMGTVGTLRDADPRALREGDCFDPAPDPDDPGADSTTVTSVDRTPCAEPHAYEVYADFAIESDKPFRSSVVEQSAWKGCADAFTGFIGTDYRDSIYGFGYLYPTAESWKDGDRQVTCYAYGDGRTTGTLEQADAPRVDL